MFEEIEEIDETVIDEVVEEVDETLDTETDEEPDEEAEGQKIPLSVLLKEKAKRKELEKKLKEFEVAEQAKETEKEIIKIKQRLITRGYTEEDAEEEAEEVYNSREMTRKMKKDLEEREFKSQLKELATSDTFFKGCEFYSDEIKTKMKEVKGLSTEEAYMLIRGKLGRKEFQTDFEQRQALARRTAGNKTVASSAGGGMTSRYSLDADDRKALATLQKVQPDGKWNVEKYYKLIKQKK